MSSIASFVVEEFQPAHIEPARRLWLGTEGMGLSEADEPQPLAAFLARNPGLSLVALRDGIVIGTILCGHDGRRGLIHHLAVADAHRRVGVGRQLLSRGLAGLRAAGIAKAHLLVFKSNALGLDFWRRVGAEDRTSLALLSIVTKDAFSEKYRDG